MVFDKTIFSDAYLIRPEPNRDARGYFERTFCQQEFAQQGITALFVQDNLSYNEKAMTLRGMHFQKKPYEEEKLLRCIAGAIDDVIVDLRLGSDTYGMWQKFHLTAENGCALYIPKGFAHGYLTLTDQTAAYYKVSQYYHPEAAYGIRWDDPAIHIDWGIAESDLILSEQDKKWPLLEMAFA